MTISKMCVYINLLFQIASIMIVLHCTRKIKKARSKINFTDVKLGVCTYVINAATNFLYTYAIYSLTTNKNTNFIFLSVMWFLGNSILEIALYISMTPKEWQIELTEAVKYELLGQLLLLFCIIILRLGLQ